jgi:Leucine-rich repeat (LRR) protein
LESKVEAIKFNNYPNLISAVESLHLLKNVKHWYLSGQQVIDEGNHFDLFLAQRNVVVHLVTQCPNIVTLDISGNPAIGDIGIRYLASLKHLRFLNVSGCIAITSEGLVQTTSSLPNLEALNTSRTLISDSFFAHIPNTICNLKISECAALTNDSNAL